MRISLLILALFLSVAAAGCSESGKTAPAAGSTAPTTAPTTAPKAGATPAKSAAPRVELVDLAGKLRHPLDVEPGRHGSVLLFVAPECPISNGYAPEIQRLCDAYQAKGFDFFVIYSDPDLTTAEANKHSADYGFNCPVILDSKQQLAQAVGATVTPQAALIGPQDGKLLYLGRIDNVYAALGKRRFAASTHDLRDALDATLSGKPIENPRTKSIGCEIPGLPAATPAAASENKS